MGGDIGLIGDDGAVQALVEQHVGVLGNGFPRREGARLLPVGLGFLGVVQIAADLAGAGFAVGLEQVLQFLEQVRIGPEVAVAVVASGVRVGDRGLHLGPVVAVEAVALDEGDLDVLAPEDLIEGAHHRSGTGPGRAGDRDDRM